jgi:hypothetical protein
MNVFNNRLLFTTRAQREVIPKLGGPCVVTCRCHVPEHTHAAAPPDIGSQGPSSV